MQAAVTAGDKLNVEQVLILCGLLIVLLIVSYVVIVYLRRRLLAGSREEPSAALTMEDIESLRKNGQLSEEEFSRLRQSLMGLDKPDTKGQNSALRQPAKDDDGNQEELRAGQ